MIDHIDIVKHNPWLWNTLTTILLIFLVTILAHAFFNQANQEAEVELNIWDKLKFKLRTKK
ncbi:MAG: hypothetical protein QNJ55_17385 [Xenococcus sp. MO_188.B8]|nr:hypothetical protein [Xenococcus sp. MO_188.B8]